MTTSKTSLALALLCLSLFARAETFTFTAIPDEDESRLVQRFTQVSDYLEKELGVEVNYIPVKSYAAAVTAFRNNQVQLAWFGGLSGVQARLQVPDSLALAQGYEDQFFKTYIIAHKSAGLTKSDNFPNAIKGKTFTFGSKGSTSGRLMPEFFIREHFKQAPQKVFQRVGFSGDHSMTIAQVQAGAYQLGAVNYLVWETELAAGKIDLTKASVIWETPNYADYQWTIRGDADKRYGKGFTEKVRKTLLNMKEPSLLQAFPRKSFVPASNSDYEAIESTARAIDILQ
ncbi:putative selenate ABC transporter substrate-binding protein [Teredinibacter haidensis]|uniref:putative selenate ABC transporter substrate-binding protein n=1 Tax=Teredinibacter haidensis TaxID=2731755 RepID=UPI000948E8E1|nr:putative selenate ABC transporter substrate-binding protein [Teredinibacter haidensis]